MNDVFRGHLEECLKHLAARFLEAHPKGSRQASRAKQPMADFCGVNTNTVTEWLYHGKHLPVGESQLKALFFLELNGYSVIELERMPSKCRNFARLIGFGLITVDQATDMLGYSETSSLYKLLREGHDAVENREQKLWDMWKARKDKLDEAAEKATRRFRLQLGQVVRPTPDVEAMANQPSISCPFDGVVDIMQGLLKMFESGILHNLSDEDLESLHPDSNTILRLSAHLSNTSARLMGPR